MTPEWSAEASLPQPVVGHPAPPVRPTRVGLRAWGTALLTRRRRVLVAAGDAMRQLAALLDPQDRRVRFVDASRPPGQLMERLRAEAADEVYFDLGAGIDERILASLGARLLMDGVDVHFVFPHLGRPPVQAQLTALGSQSVVSLRALPDGLWPRALRRLVDLVGATVLLLVLSPVLAAVGMLVWWHMGRPIFYAQERVGRGGRLFRLYKFRSMVSDAEALLRASPEAYRRYVACNFKVPADEDPRITPLGRFLRRASLDELPQLWNVLRGEMSLVGPRAIVPEELEQYGDYARLLVRVKPGLTGLWQVSGRSAIGYPERARLDLQYVGRRSFAGDLKILLRTLPAVLRQRGAL